jgi:hypothetical protein
MKQYRQDPSAPSHLRKLVDSARLHDLDEDKRRAVAKRLGIASALGPPPNPSVESSRLLRTPARVSVRGIALTVLALASGATYVAVSRPSPARHAVVSISNASPLPTSKAEPPPPVETASVSVTTLLDAPAKPVPNARAEHAPVVKPAASTEPGTKGGDLRLEVIALDRVHRTTDDGRPREALALLDEYATKFPRGKLREEATVLRIEALHANGDQARAESLAEQLLRDSPSTPYAARIRSALLPDAP